MKDTLLAIFGIFTMASGAGVVLSRSPVYAAFSLILSFFGLSTIYILWGATFIAMIQILVYTGAIVVLFVFVVMLLNLGRGSGSPSRGATFAITAAAGVWFFSLLLLKALNLVRGGGATAPETVNDVQKISLLLFSDYLWPFEVLSLFLLALIVAIFALARPDALEKEGT